MASAQKIRVKNPVVELDGDEMTRIIWQDIKDRVSSVAHALISSTKTNFLTPAVHPPVSTS